ncbi:hypothetical protein CGZ96_00315 [Enemella evansiae]|nr:hypothetical protein CGZ96_00315 [Enemella evansiae]
MLVLLVLDLLVLALVVLFLAGAFFAVVFFAGVFFAVAFLAGAFLAGAFFVGAFFAVPVPLSVASARSSTSATKSALARSAAAWVRRAPRRAAVAAWARTSTIRFSPRTAISSKLRFSSLSSSSNWTCTCSGRVRASSGAWSSRPFAWPGASLSSSVACSSCSLRLARRVRASACLVSAYSRSRSASTSVTPAAT